MDMTQLQYFCEIADKQNVTKASKNMNITQSALSSSLHRLEEEVGAALFDRIGRRIVLNGRGEVFYGHAKAILREYQEAIRDAALDMSPASGRITLTCTESNLPEKLIAGFKARHPEVYIHEKWISYKELAKIEKDEETDFFLSSLPLGGEKIRSSIIMDERFYLVVPQSHKLFARAFVNMEELAGESFLALPEGTVGRICFEEICGKAGFAPRISQECYQHQIQAMIRKGLGVGFFPEEMIRSGVLLEDLKILPVINDYCHRTIYIGRLAKRAWRETDRKYIKHLGLQEMELS